MRISELYKPDGPLQGREVYICGSGPSIDCWPDKALEGETCILLNDLCQHRPTWGPIAFANNRKFLKRSKCPINVCKGRLIPPELKRAHGAMATDNHVSWKDPDLYVFSYRSLFQGDEWEHFDPACLFREPDFYWNEPGGTVAIFAMQFALMAGAKRIRCIGCDSSKLIQRYHEDKEEIRRRKQNAVKHDYSAYQRGGCRMIREAWDRFGVLITHETPWIGYGMERERYKEQRAWLNAKQSA